MRDLSTKWIREVEKEINKIKTWKIEDRLSIVAALTYCNSSVASSVNGWTSWLTNALIMEKFKEEELKEIFKEFTELTIKWLELDLKYTKLLMERQKEKKEESEKKKVGKYVA